VLNENGRTVEEQLAIPSLLSQETSYSDQRGGLNLRQGSTIFLTGRLYSIRSL